MEDQLIFVIAILFFSLLFTVGLWSGISFTVSRIFGWHKISEHYWGKLEHFNKRFVMQSLSTSLFGNYSAIVNFAVSDDYLGISVLFMYRMGHPPLKIPLTDINGIQKTTFLFPRVHLQLNKIPSQNVAIPLRLAEKIEQASGGNWSFERPL